MAASIAGLANERYYELIVVLDDATSEIYYAQLVEAESTRTVMAALREVVETRGLFCSLYSDRAGHFFVTPKHGERVDTSRPTQVGRALGELGVKMIAAYSPQARGRSERNFGTWSHGRRRLARVGSHLTRGHQSLQVNRKRHHARNAQGTLPRGRLFSFDAPTDRNRQCKLETALIPEFHRHLARPGYASP